MLGKNKFDLRVIAAGKTNICLELNIINLNLLNISSFVSVGLLVIIHLLPFWTLVTVLLALPATVGLTRQIKDGLRGDWNSIAALEQKQAQFHFRFGALMSLGILFSIYF